MQDRDRQIVLEFRSRLEAVMPILEMWVFGSRAGDTAREDSDLDVFIKAAKINRSLREKIHELAWEVGFEYGHVISTFVVTEAQMETGAVGASPLLAKVFEKGIAL